MSTSVRMKGESSHEAEFILEEEDIKVEETCLQDPNVSPCFPKTVIIEQELPICLVCKCVFERKENIKLQNEFDSFKCNRCILHTRLSQVFNTLHMNKRRKCLKTRRKSMKMEDDVIFVSEIESIKKRIKTKKVVFECIHCRNHFERTDSTGIRNFFDWSKCNKCILHSRLDKVFRPGKQKQDVSK